MPPYVGLMPHELLCKLSAALCELCKRSLQVSAFVTAAQVTFVLLHDGRNDDTVKLFFRDVYEVRSFTPACCCPRYLAPAAV